MALANLYTIVAAHGKYLLLSARVHLIQNYLAFREGYN